MTEMLAHLLAHAPDLTVAGPARRAASNFISAVTYLPVRLGG
jgi:hypothetical protein